MEKYLKKLPKEVLGLIYLARDVACSDNMPVYLVGGFVRDLLLRVKNLDLDIVVEGNGIKFAEDFAARLKAKLIRHRRFGTATVIVKPGLKIDPSTSSFDKPRTNPEQAKRVEGSLRVNGERSRTIDITTSRKEFYPEAGHLPQVTSGTLKDDLLRRDFTINAMAIDISCGNFGKLIDFTGGKRDLDNRKIRILHNLSFTDDPTRILRAIRFETRYNFRIEPKTLKFLKAAIKLKMLDKLEPQRIRDDLILILKEKCPLKEIRHLHKLAGFSFISPGVYVTQRTYKLLRSIERQINWFKKAYPQRRQIDAWLIYFIALLDRLSINEFRDICHRFALGKGEEKRILDYKKINHKLISRLNKEKVKPSKIFAMLEPLSYEVILLLKAKYKSRNIQRHIEDFFRDYHGMRIYVSGHDLHSLGVKPGPDYQRILAKVLEEKLDGVLKTKEKEVRLVKKLIKSK